MGRSSRGFTLIELLTVVAVLGVLAAIAFPNMRSYLDKQRLVSQVRVIADLAQLARAEAIKHSGTGAQRTISMSVSAPTPSTWFVGLINGDAACSSAATCVINQAGTATPYYLTPTECTGCTMTSHATAARIAFDMRGLATTTGGADQLITLQSPLGKQLSVSVSRLGRISLCTPGGSVGGYPSC
jgi:type IV fimbrial biogenesis protein FimT